MRRLIQWIFDDVRGLFLDDDNDQFHSPIWPRARDNFSLSL